MMKADQNKNSNDLMIVRIFDAPRELVWKAWTEPENVKRWWGPKGFTSPVSKIDLRVGGRSLYAMRSPEGKDFWSTGVYREIVPFERIVATDSFADENGNIVPASHYGLSGVWPLELLVTVTFEEQSGRTKFTLRHVGLPPGEMSDLTKAGWNESFDNSKKSWKRRNHAGKKPFLSLNRENRRVPSYASLMHHVSACSGLPRTQSSYPDGGDREGIRPLSTGWM